MGEMSEAEKQQIASEARDAVASRPAGSSKAQRDAAMRRYLGAQEYHELRQDESGSPPRSDDERQK